MRFVTEPMRVLDFGVWEIDGKPVTNKAGEPVENVAFLDLDADEIHRFTLREVNGERPKELTQTRLVCEAQTASRGRDDGSVTSKLKVAVVGFEKVERPSAPPASNKS
jgi:hypothetical protein